MRLFFEILLFQLCLPVFTLSLGRFATRRTGFDGFDYSGTQVFGIRPRLSFDTLIADSASGGAESLFDSVKKIFTAFHNANTRSARLTFHYLQDVQLLNAAATLQLGSRLKAEHAIVTNDAEHRLFVHATIERMLCL